MSEINIRNKNPLIRKRKNFFLLSKSKKKKNLKLIRDEAVNNLNEICKSMGLRINELKVGPEDENQINFKPKITLNKKNLTKDYKAYVWMMAKDFTNMSRKKYKIMRKLFSRNLDEKIPGYKRVEKIQSQLNEFFILKSNDYGYFNDPASKIKFVASKFLLKNDDFFTENQEKILKIKLSADSVTISRKNIKLLNFTFSLLDDVENCKSVFGHFSLGRFFCCNHFFKNIYINKRNIYFFKDNST